MNSCNATTQSQDNDFAKLRTELFHSVLLWPFYSQQDNFHSCLSIKVYYLLIFPKEKKIQCFQQSAIVILSPNNNASNWAAPSCRSHPMTEFPVSDSHSPDEEPCTIELTF